MGAKNRMTANPVVARFKTSHQEGMKLHKDHYIGHLPVVDDAGLVRIIVSETVLLNTGPSRFTSLSNYESTDEDTLLKLT
jgi:CBS-domain-containing membrane protein